MRLLECGREGIRSLQKTSDKNVSKTGHMEETRELEAE